jgi:hypothetical protein
MKSQKPKKKSNTFKYIVKVFITTFLLYSLFYVACSKEETSKKENVCPFSVEIRDKFFFWKEQFPDFLEKFKDFSSSFTFGEFIIQKTNKKLKEPQVKQVVDQLKDLLVKLKEYYHYSAQVFVFKVIPQLSDYLSVAKRILVNNVFPWIREKIRISAVYLRQNYPRKSINLIKEFVIEKLQKLQKIVLDAKAVQDLLKNQNILEISGQISAVFQVVMEKLMLWLGEYPSIGFDYLWRVLEDDVSSEEYVEIYNNLRNLFKLS